MPLILGFSAFPSPSSTGIRTYRVPGTQVTIPVKAEIAPLLVGYAAEYHRTVEPLVRGWCWGWAYRAIRGLSSPSRHSAGIAVDLNAPRHPLGHDPRRSFTPAQIAQIRSLCRKYGLRWGGDYRIRKDGMHAELNVDRATALALVRKLQATPPKRAKPPKRPTTVVPVRPPTVRPPVAGPTIRQGARGAHVVRWQKGLGACGWHVGTDGDFGPATHRATVAFQRKVGLTPDGVVGPRSWAQMLRRVRV